MLSGSVGRGLPWQRLSAAVAFCSGVWGALVVAASVVDTTPPSLALRGQSALTYKVGDIWKDPGADCIDPTGPLGTAEQPLPVDVAGAPPAGVFQNAAYYVATYTCKDDAGNDAAPVTRTIQVVAAARHWRIKTLGTVGSATTTWQVKGITLYSDIWCTKGIPVVPRRAGTRWPNGFSFSTPLGATRRADTAFAVWTKAGTSPTSLGSGWSAGHLCQDIAGPECFVGFAFEEPVVVNCVMLDQGTDPGSYATGLRVQWQRNLNDGDVLGGGVYSDFVVERSLTGGSVTLRRPCPLECGGCNSAGHTSGSCASYSPGLSVTGVAGR